MAYLMYCWCCINVLIPTCHVNVIDIVFRQSSSKLKTNRFWHLFFIWYTQNYLKFFALRSDLGKTISKFKNFSWYICYFLQFNAKIQNWWTAHFLSWMHLWLLLIVPCCNFWFLINIVDTVIIRNDSMNSINKLWILYELLYFCILYSFCIINANIV